MLFINIYKNHRNWQLRLIRNAKGIFFSYFYLILVFELYGITSKFIEKHNQANKILLFNNWYIFVYCYLY